MGYNPNISNLFYSYSLPSFLDTNTFDITNGDTVIELGEGIYTLDFSISLNQHNVTIKGQGRDKTILIVPANINYSDDAIINLQGLYKTQIGQEADIRIAVNISGLTIMTDVSKAAAEARVNKLTENETYIIKCYNVGSLVMRDVRICAENLETTCLDVRRGFNIDIRNCEFINRNRRWTGGNVWLRGDTENVIIEDNDFYKYGNDEIIALYGSNSFEDYNVSTAITKRNVMIRNNRIFCQDTTGGSNPSGIITENNGNWDGINQRLICFITNQDDNKVIVNNHTVQNLTPCAYTIDGIHFENNDIHINAPISHLITAAFDKNTDFKDVVIKNNIISYGNWTVDNSNNPGWNELMDFCIYYDTQYGTSLVDTYNQYSDEPLLITGNTITCGTNARNYYNQSTGTYEDNHICVHIRGAKVIFNDNHVLCRREAFTIDENTFAQKGIDIFLIDTKKGTAVFYGNYCEGVKALATIKGATDNKISESWIHGSGNHLYGNIKLIYENVASSHVWFSGNNIISDYPIIFLSEFADSGTAVFTENRVYRDMSRVTYFQNPEGIIYYTGNNNNNNNNIVSMKLICCNNVFDNLNFSNAIMYAYVDNIDNISTIHDNNIFADTVE